MTVFPRLINREYPPNTVLGVYGVTSMSLRRPCSNVPRCPAVSQLFDNGTARRMCKTRKENNVLRTGEDVKEFRFP